jgi:polygalacturonase
MGEGTIDGRGYGRLFGEKYSWWQLARAAEPKDDRYYSVKLIVADHADNFTLYGIHLVNSPNYHVVVSHTNGFTAWGVHLQTPVVKEYSGDDDDEDADNPTSGPVDARNTDGIDPGTSENITIAHSWIDNGDDNIAIKQGVKHMSVIDDHFYNGHGMSIGSETELGQSFLLVDGLTEDHTTSGIRIKSNVTRGGSVHDLTYQNICMRNVAIPIAISPYYTNMTVEPFEDPKYEGFKIPDYKAITLKDIFAETPGDVLIAGLNDDHRTGITLDNVNITGIRQDQVHLAFDDVTSVGSGANFKLTGKNVAVKEIPAKGTPSPDTCRDKFAPYR